MGKWSHFTLLITLRGPPCVPQKHPKSSSHTKTEVNSDLGRLWWSKHLLRKRDWMSRGIEIIAIYPPQDASVLLAKTLVKTYKIHETGISSLIDLAITKINPSVWGWENSVIPMDLR